MANYPLHERMVKDGWRFEGLVLGQNGYDTFDLDLTRLGIEVARGLETERYNHARIIPLELVVEGGLPADERLDNPNLHTLYVRPLGDLVNKEPNASFFKTIHFPTGDILHHQFPYT